MTRSINEWMIENKIALSTWQAGHIYEGLKLFKCKSFEEQVARVTLYRKWRPKTDVKNEIPAKQAYDLAIAGIDPDDVQVRQMEFSPSVERAIKDLNDHWYEEMVVPNRPSAPQSSLKGG